MILAKNYLDVNSSQMFGEIRQLSEKTSITHANVANNLMPKSADEDEETCLKNLI